jgi:uncharacterized protein
MSHGDSPVPNVEPAVPAASPEQVQPPASHSFLRNTFFGPNGLRALWRLLIFIGVVAALFFIASYVTHRRGITDFSAKAVLIRDGISFALVLIATGIMGYFEKRPFAEYGLPLRGAFGTRFFEGLLWGFLAELATMGILYLTGNASFHGFDQRGGSALYYAAMWGLAFLMVGFFEEFLFRGYPQFTLATGIGFWPAAILLSGVFWLGHMGNPGETWVGGLATALAALVFCVSLRLTGNLWFAVWHACELGLGRNVLLRGDG